MEDIKYHMPSHNVIALLGDKVNGKGLGPFEHISNAILMANFAHLTTWELRDSLHELDSFIDRIKAIG